MWTPTQQRCRNDWAAFRHIGALDQMCGAVVQGDVRHWGRWNGINFSLVPSAATLFGSDVTATARPEDTLTSFHRSTKLHLCSASLLPHLQKPYRKIRSKIKKNFARLMMSSHHSYPSHNNQNHYPLWTAQEVILYLTALCYQETSLVMSELSSEEFQLPRCACCRNNPFTRHLALAIHGSCVN